MESRQPQAAPSTTTALPHPVFLLPNSPLDPDLFREETAFWLERSVLTEVAGLHEAGTGQRLRATTEVTAHGVLTEATRRAAADRISKRYSLAPQAALWIVHEAETAASEAGIDPLLLLAVVGVESRFNPYAGSSAGAMGFTQTIPRAHPEAVALIEADGRSVLDPQANLRLGAGVLKTYLTLQHGDLTRALQQYNGALGDETGAYAGAVLRTYQQLKTGDLKSRGAVHSS